MEPVPRPRLQFGIRTFLFVMTAIGIFHGAERATRGTQFGLGPLEAIIYSVLVLYIDVRLERLRL